jgi:hypothetical protein
VLLCVPGIVAIIPKIIEPLIFFSSYKKNKVRVHLPACVRVSRRAFVILRKHFLFHMGHDPWNTLYMPRYPKVLGIRFL